MKYLCISHSTTPCSRWVLRTQRRTPFKQHDQNTAADHVANYYVVVFPTSGCYVVPDLRQSGVSSHYKEQELVRSGGGIMEVQQTLTRKRAAEYATK